MASQRPGVSPKPLSAFGRSSNRLSLPTLQSKMKSDPEGYKSELVLVYSQFKSSLELFQQQATLNFTSITGITTDPAVAKDLGDRAMLLAHVTPFYPQHLADFPKQLSQFLASSACSLPLGLRCHIVQSLIPLANRKMVDIGETLALFMELQTMGDRALRKLAFSHVVHSLRQMNHKHKNEAKNRQLQNILFSLLQQEDEAKAKRSLITLCELHRRRVWFDDRTADAICTTCFHSSSRIMIVALSFLLYYEKIQDKDHSDALSSEDDLSPQVPQAVLCKEAVYKGFTEKLFCRLQTCNEHFEPHQCDITNLLAAAVQACHDMVPPDAVESLFKQIVNLFVHDHSCPEVIAVGLNVIREICLRMPLLITLPQILWSIEFTTKIAIRVV